MISPERIALLCAALVGAAPSLAEEPAAPGLLARSLEMPAHRALMAVRSGAAPAPFVTDGCSGGLSEAWPLVAGHFPELTAPGAAAPVFEPCCVIHDRAYHDAGGATDAEASFDARLAADRALRACVIERGNAISARDPAGAGTRPQELDRAYRAIAGAMYLAVRFGGAPCSGLPWRWGFGYPGCSVLGAAVAVPQGD